MTTANASGNARVCNPLAIRPGPFDATPTDVHRSYSYGVHHGCGIRSVDQTGHLAIGHRTNSASCGQWLARNNSQLATVELGAAGEVWRSVRVSSRAAAARTAERPVWATSALSLLRSNATGHQAFGDMKIQARPAVTKGAATVAYAIVFQIAFFDRVDNYEVRPSLADSVTASLTAGRHANDIQFTNPRLPCSAQTALALVGVPHWVERWNPSSRSARNLRQTGVPEHGSPILGERWNE